jgi:WD40 repeat protein
MDGTVMVWDLATGAGRTLSSGAPLAEVAFSPTEPLLASTMGKEIWLWDPSSGTHRVLGAHDGRVQSVAFRRDGARLVSTSGDTTVRIWTIHQDGHGDGAPTILRGHEGLTAAAEFSPDGASIASVGMDNTVRLWDLASGSNRVVARSIWFNFHLGFSADGKRLLMLPYTQARIVDLTSDASRDLGPQGQGWAGAWSLDGRVIATGHDGVRVWNAETMTARLLVGQEMSVSTVAVSADGAWVAAGNTDGTIRVWPTPANRTSILHDLDGCNMQDLSNGGLLATACEDKTVRLLDMNTRRLITLRGHDAPIRRVALSRTREGRAYSMASDRTVRAWDIASGTSHVVWTFERGGEDLGCSDDGTRLLVSDGDTKDYVLDADSGATLCTLETTDGGAAQISPDGARVVYAAADVVKIMDVAGCQSRTLYKHEHGLGVSKLVFSADGRRVASGGYDTKVGLWDAEQGPRLLAGHAQIVTSAAFAPVGDVLVSSSPEARVRVWDARTGRALHVLETDGPGVNLDFTPDGRALFTSTSDDTMRVWDLESGETLWREPDTGKQGYAVSPDGKLVISSADDGMHVWPVVLPAPLPADIDALRAWLSSATTATIDSQNHAVTP